jgi:hypothetical protein
MGHIGLISIGDGVELELTCPLHRIGLSSTLTRIPKPRQRHESGHLTAILRVGPSRLVAYVSHRLVLALNSTHTCPLHRIGLSSTLTRIPKPRQRHESNHLTAIIRVDPSKLVAYVSQRLVLGLNSSSRVYYTVLDCLRS